MGPGRLFKNIGTQVERNRPIFLRVCVLGSGSRGNSIFIESPNTRLLIDAGFNAARTAEKLGRLGISLGDITAILLTHEHADHAGGIKPLLKASGAPLYTNEKTRSALNLRKENPSSLLEFQTNEPFFIQDFKIQPFSVPHDAADTVCFTLENERWKVGIATDFGMIQPSIIEALKGCSVLVLEFNHDPSLLERGPYHPSLKERIRGNYGHLSNQDSAAILKQVIHPKLQHVYLAHLSHANNSGEIASLAASEAVADTGCEGVHIQPTWQDFISPVARL